MTSDAHDSLRRAEQLLEQLEAARARLERVSAEADPEETVDVLTELARIAREVEAELNRAAREAEA
jgi:hypothetical protein